MHSEYSSSREKEKEKEKIVIVIIVDYHKQTERIETMTLALYCMTSEANLV